MGHALLALALAAALGACGGAAADGAIADTAPLDTVTADTAAQDTATQDSAEFDATARDDAAAADEVTPTPPPCGTARVREELAVPTIDGYALSAFLDRPATPDCPLPTILIQTPYDKEGAWRGFFGAERMSRPLFASPHYNFVVVDWRGRFGSRDLPHGGEGPWLAQDSYDTVTWIAEQPWSDGQVGTWGVSALCGAQYRTATGPRPTPQNPDFADGPPTALKAMVPIMCALRTSWELVYPGGVLRHEWAVGLDVLGFGARAAYEGNPRRNLVWSVLDTTIPAARVRAPALVVAGWWDLTPNATIAAFRELARDSDPSVRDQHRLLIGPWIHFATGGGSTEGALRPLTDEERGYLDTDRLIDAASLAFFDLHLRGLDGGEAATWPPVRYHHAGENEPWRGAPDWPPPGSATRTLYLAPGGGLAETAPTAGAVEVPYDPADPSPTVGGATLSPYNCVSSPTPLACTLAADPARILLHGPTSQAPVLARGDAALFATPPLEAPLVLLGPARLTVEVSTTGADADVAMRLVAIGPDDTPRLIGEGVARLSAREGGANHAPVAPGSRVTVVVESLADLAMTLPAGHRLGVIVTGSHWPLFARNPNDGAALYAPDVHPATAERFTFGFPPTELVIRGEGVAVVTTVHLGAATRLEIGVP